MKPFFQKPSREFDATACRLNVAPRKDLPAIRRSILATIISALRRSHDHSSVHKQLRSTPWKDA
jgi:hypothetical protein